MDLGTGVDGQGRGLGVEKYWVLSQWRKVSLSFSLIPHHVASLAEVPEAQIKRSQNKDTGLRMQISIKTWLTRGP